MYYHIPDLFQNCLKNVGQKTRVPVNVLSSLVLFLWTEEECDKESAKPWMESLVIRVLRSWRWEGSKFKARLSYINGFETSLGSMRPSPKSNNQG